MNPKSHKFSREQQEKNTKRKLSEELDDNILNFILEKSTAQYPQNSYCYACDAPVRETYYDVMKKKQVACQLCKILKPPKIFGDD